MTNRRKTTERRNKNNKQKTKLSQARKRRHALKLERSNSRPDVCWSVDFWGCVHKHHDEFDVDLPDDSSSYDFYGYENSNVLLTEKDEDEYEGRESLPTDTLSQCEDMFPHSPSPSPPPQEPGDEEDDYE